MIFTEEQIKRLPGSKVLLRNGKRVVVGSDARQVGRYSWSMTVDDPGVQWAYADTIANAATRCPRDIVAVLEWADEMDERLGTTIEVGMVFEGRAVEGDGYAGDLNSRPITWETFLDVEGQSNLPGKESLGVYGRSFRTEIRIVEELTDPEEYAKYLEKKRASEHKQEVKELRKAARLGRGQRTFDID